MDANIIFTPGPWKVVNPHYRELRIEAPESEASICTMGLWEAHHQSEQEANTRLIASAPILLEACQEAENTFAEYGERAGFPDGAPECWAAIEALRAAIAVAERKDGAG